MGKHPILRMAALPIAFVLAGVPESTCGQQTTSRVLSFQERDQDNHNRELSDQISTVDINSRLTVRIDKKALQHALPPPVPNSALTATIRRAQALSKAASTGQASLQAVASALTNWVKAARDRHAVQPLQDAIKPAAGAALQVIDQAPLGSPFRQQLNLRLATTTSVIEQFHAVFETAEAEALTLQQQVAALPQEAREYYVLGAWLATAAGTNPIHVEGFDTYPAGERIEIARWTITLTEAQKAELQELAKDAKKLNDSGTDILAQLATAAGPSLLTLVEKALPCVQDVGTKISALQQTGASSVKQAEAELERYRAALDSYASLLNNLKSKYQTGTSQVSTADFLIGTNDDLTRLVDQTKSLLDVLKALQKLPAEIKETAAQVQTALHALITSVRACAQDATSAVSSLSDLRTSLEAGLSGRKVTASLLEFGSAVSRLDIGALPDEATISLINSGQRAGGDTLVIKIGTGRGESKPHDLESREFQILRLLPHIDTVVGLIFAHPQGASDLKAHFQAAPAYSVLYKFGCSSPTCRKLWDVGVGLNVSALDFNHDDVPELGVGLVGSIVRDYLQAGFGFNVPRKQWYGFFGLRLPLPTFTLPSTEGASGSH